MSNRNPPDPGGDARREVKQRRLRDFVESLIAAADVPGGSGVRWAPFLSRAEVQAELEKRGLTLECDGAVFDPRKVRFWAQPR
jgi:hypothetical protein